MFMRFYSFNGFVWFQKYHECFIDFRLGIFYPEKSNILNLPRPRRIATSRIKISWCDLKNEHKLVLEHFSQSTKTSALKSRSCAMAAGWWNPATPSASNRAATTASSCACGCAPSTSCPKASQPEASSWSFPRSKFVISHDHWILTLLVHYWV